jgi:hypothetical protein
LPEFGSPAPDQFVLGSVIFQRFQAFVSDFAQAVNDGRKSTDEKALELFSEPGAKYGWVASVKIPRCAADVSLRRAEELVEAGIIC